LAQFGEKCDSVIRILGDWVIRQVKLPNHPVSQYPALYKFNYRNEGELSYVQNPMVVTGAGDQRSHLERLRHAASRRSGGR
jgi:hypothetical protein